MRRWHAIAVVILLVAAACGGGSGDGADDGAADDTTTTTQAASDEGSDETTTTTEQATDDGGSVDTTATTASNDDSGGDEEGSGPSFATVTLDGETYEFSTEGAIVAQCLTNLFGIFSVQLPMADGGDGGIGIVALYPDTDPEVVGEVNSVTVSIGDEDDVADEEDMMFESSDKLEPGMSQVDSVEIDGRTVRGTATFFKQSTLFVGDEVEVVTGTFEATCGEERTS
jgi:hypothetical protein